MPGSTPTNLPSRSRRPPQRSNTIAFPVSGEPPSSSLLTSASYVGGLSSIAVNGYGNPITIVVMGCTGSGKSSFINQLSHANFDVSGDLNSCTTGVDFTPVFARLGRQVRLIDTPGFDDTTRDDVEVLEMIATTLAELYRTGTGLHGIIYLHRISDNKMSGISRKSLDLFKAICGPKAFRNTALVTTMWDIISLEDAEERETQLVSDHRFFAPLVEGKASVFRHNNTLISAQNILSSMMNNIPIPLLVQEELIDLQRTLMNTTAGQELYRRLQDTARTREREVNELEAELREVSRKGDRRITLELTQELARQTASLNEIVHKTKRLVSTRYIYYRPRGVGTRSLHSPHPSVDRSSSTQTSPTTISPPTKMYLLDPGRTAFVTDPSSPRNDQHGAKSSQHFKTRFCF